MVFGLTVTSSWGNGHATLWRGMIRALARAGCEVVFFERDAPYYAQHRDLTQIEGARIVLYAAWPDIAAEARREVSSADAAMVTSYCPDSQPAHALVAECATLPVFYDLDTPVTLARLAGGERAPWLPPEGLKEYALVLSYAGGPALRRLQTELQAQRVAPLYGHVDPQAHLPAAPQPRFAGALSYLGTCAADRAGPLATLFARPARLRPDQRFILGGAGYGPEFPWSDNILYVPHVPPPEHGAFFSSSPLTLNVTRADMAALGWCPSGRLFEAAACGAAIVSDAWEGLEAFFAPGAEILIVRDTSDVLAALDLAPAERARIAAAARARVLAEHTSERRAGELLDLLGAGAGRARAAA